MSLNANHITVWLFGNYTIDSKIYIKNDKEIVIQSYGGSVNFGSQTLKVFYPDIQYKVFSNGYPSSQNPEFTEKLTHYILDYTTETRTLKLQYFPTGEINFPLNSDIKPNIVFLTPVYHELSENLVINLRKKFSDVLFAYDPQGWCRELNPISNEIVIKEWFPSEIFLQSNTIIKMSSEDLKLSAENNLEDFIQKIVNKKVILIITAGLRGNICIYQKNLSESLICFYTPVKSVSKMVDTTGAGDVWLVAFTTTFYATKDIKKSLATAAVLASCKVQAEGLHFPVTIKKDLQQMIQDHEKQIINLEFNKDELLKIFSDKKF